jgi:hypothetical protein
MHADTLKYYPFTYATNGEKLAKLNDSIRKEAGTIMLLDFPAFSKTSGIWLLVNQCSVLKTFSDKGKVLAYIFDCRNIKGK